MEMQCNRCIAPLYLRSPLCPPRLDYISTLHPPNDLFDRWVEYIKMVFETLSPHSMPPLPLLYKFISVFCKLCDCFRQLGEKMSLPVRLASRYTPLRTPYNTESHSQICCYPSHCKSNTNTHHNTHLKPSVDFPKILLFAKP